MSSSAVEPSLPASTTSPPAEVATASAVSDAARSPGGDRQLLAQDSERVYQAVGNQYILDHLPRAMPTPAVATNSLPRDVPAFAGRDEELDSLTTLVDHRVAKGGTIPVFTIDGMPGVGKTTFAVHAAHKLSSSFPDGKMFVDLHAHTPGMQPVAPAEALFALLAVDGIPAEAIPDDVDGRSALWRARMAGRRSIFVVDNAVSHRQVEPLLPGAAGCLVLVTSRRRLTGLAARHGAAMVSLDPLPPSSAADLFVRLTSGVVGEGQEVAVAELVQLCGRLPLAISLLAARLRPEPQWQVRAMVDDLMAAQDRLADMRAEDIHVAAAFDLSYKSLPAARRRFFRCLGLNLGVDVDTYAAAALGGVGLATARRHLEALYDDHLLDQPVRGRFRLHDLLGAYARKLVAGDGTGRQDAAIERLLDYYQHTAAIANGHIAPRPRDAAGPPTMVPAAVPDLADAAQASTWTNAELPNLLACASYAMSHGDDVRLIEMSAALAAFLRRAGPYGQSIALHRGAADAASRCGDQAAQATALYHVGVLLRRAGDYPAATEVLTEARDLHRSLGDRVGEAAALTVMGIIQRLTGDYTSATVMLEEALSHFSELADEAGQAEALAELAVSRWLVDDYVAAAQLLDRALALYLRVGNQQGQAGVWHYMGMLRRLTHDYQAAIHALQQAMTLYRSLGARLGVAHTQFSLGVLCRLNGDQLGAVRRLEDSLQVYREVGDRLGQANSLRELSILWRLVGHHSDATHALLEGIALYQDLGNRRGKAEALQELGVVRRLTGETSQAAEDLTEAFAVYEELGSRTGQAEVLNYLGDLLLDTDDPEALDQFQAALQLARQVGNPLEEAHALEGIARCALRQHDVGQAAQQLQLALEIYQRIGAPEAAQVEATLATLSSGPPQTGMADR